MKNSLKETFNEMKINSNVNEMFDENWMSKETFDENRVLKKGLTKIEFKKRSMKIEC